MITNLHRQIGLYTHLVLPTIKRFLHDSHTASATGRTGLAAALSLGFNPYRIRGNSNDNTLFLNIGVI
jgi:hypothetical protein